MKVLLLDSDPTTARALEPELGLAELCVGSSQREGLRLAIEGDWDLIILDADFGGGGLEILSRFSTASSCSPPVVILAESPSMELALKAIGNGAHDVLSKPISGERIRETLRTIGGSARVRPVRTDLADAEGVVGGSLEMLAVYKAIARAARSDATVLILGESGTGKEMVARVLHQQSGRSHRPFVAINCAAIPDNLLESELFGHEKGAFTGAIGRRIGRFERANGGTLFLDEIGDMSLALQSKILRALQEREIERVGGGSAVPINVRIVAATNRDLEGAVRTGGFRDDLFYRLAVVSLPLPPLRSRGEDLDLLVEHFVARYASEHGRPINGISEDLIETLRLHPWPGNVRQLRNAIERAVVMSTGKILRPQHLPSDIINPAPSENHGDDRSFAPLCTLKEMERRMISRALADTPGNLTLTAEKLGIHRNTLRRKITQYEIEIQAD